MKKHVLHIGSLCVRVASLVAGSVQADRPGPGDGEGEGQGPGSDRVPGRGAERRRFRARSTPSGRRLAARQQRQHVRSVSAGRRGINWDGGGSTDRAIVPSRSTGSSSLAAAASDPRRRLRPGAGRRASRPPSTILRTRRFKAFSPVRLFSPLDSNVTTARFFIPGGGEVPAATNAFGVVFTDVDQQDGEWDHEADHAPPCCSTACTATCCIAPKRQRRRGTASLSFVGVHFRRGPGGIRPHQDR